MPQWIECQMAAWLTPSSDEQSSSSTFFSFVLYFEGSADDVSPCNDPNLQEWKLNCVSRFNRKRYCQGYWSIANEHKLQGRKDPLTSFPMLSTTGNLRYLVSSSNLAAASRLVFSRTAKGEEVITSPMTFPLVLLNSLCISWNVCRTVNISKKKSLAQRDEQ